LLIIFLEIVIKKEVKEENSTLINTEENKIKTENVEGINYFNWTINYLNISNIKINW